MLEYVFYGAAKMLNGSKQECAEGFDALTERVRLPLGLGCKTFSHKIFISNEVGYMFG